ncbi:MAG: hypothetical protein R2695_15625 [Acidimicrobiales bacterium]
MIDEGALAELLDDDPDHAVALLAEMTAATDPALAALARRLAGRLVLDLARVGPAESRGVGRLARIRGSSGGRPRPRREPRGVDAGARRSGADRAGDLLVRHWTKPTMAIALLVDRSGSMNGDRLAVAAVAAAGCAWRAPADWSVLAFADRQLAVKSQGTGGGPPGSWVICSGCEVRAPPTSTRPCGRRPASSNAPGPSGG